MRSNEKAETSLERDRSFENKISTIQREKINLKNNKVIVAKTNNYINKSKSKTIEDTRTIDTNKEISYKKEILKLK